MGLSKSQIDKLGDRLKRGNITEADLRLLDQYRLSFTQAYETVIGAVRNDLNLEPTGRPAKSTTSISDKLRRESIRLSQIQDIAGCRVVVEYISDQNKVVESLGKLFDSVNVIDRRERPSHGYRAVHVVVNHGGKAVEIQVRTRFQHLWAELSEKLSDRIDPAIKYGGGGELVQKILMGLSSALAEDDALTMHLLSLNIPLTISPDDYPRDLKDAVYANRQKIISHIQDLIDLLGSLEGEKNDFSNRV